jgi:hypothetical protein
VTVSKDRRIIDSEMVVERTQLPENALRIVTEQSGTDNDRRHCFVTRIQMARRPFRSRKMFNMMKWEAFLREISSPGVNSLDTSSASHRAHGDDAAKKVTRSLLNWADLANPAVLGPRYS